MVQPGKGKPSRTVAGTAAGTVAGTVAGTAVAGTAAGTSGKKKKKTQQKKHHEQPPLSPIFFSEAPADVVLLICTLVGLPCIVRSLCRHTALCNSSMLKNSLCAAAAGGEKVMKWCMDETNAYKFVDGCGGQRKIALTAKLAAQRPTTDVFLYWQETQGVQMDQDVCIKVAISLGNISLLRNYAKDFLWKLHASEFFETACYYGNSDVMSLLAQHATNSGEIGNYDFTRALRQAVRGDQEGAFDKVLELEQRIKPVALQSHSDRNKSMYYELSDAHSGAWNWVTSRCTVMPDDFVQECFYRLQKDILQKLLQQLPSCSFLTLRDALMNRVRCDCCYCDEYQGMYEKGSPRCEDVCERNCNSLIRMIDMCRDHQRRDGNSDSAMHLLFGEAKRDFARFLKLIVIRHYTGIVEWICEVEHQFVSAMQLGRHLLEFAVAHANIPMVKMIIAHKDALGHTESNTIFRPRLWMHAIRQMSDSLMMLHLLIESDARYNPVALLRLVTARSERLDTSQVEEMKRCSRVASFLTNEIAEEYAKQHNRPHPVDTEDDDWYDTQRRIANWPGALDDESEGEQEFGGKQVFPDY